MNRDESFFSSGFSIGSLKLSSRVLYAPLAGCSDLPFRKMALKYGSPALTFCEMVKIDALVRNDPNTYRLLDYEKDMHPIGAQICGSKPKLAKESAKIIEDLGFDVLDLNCGCPVDKVTKDGSGSAMLKTPEKIGEMISAMVSAVKIPVTLKIRAGWDEEEILAPQITQIAEKAGAKAISIHGRTRKQAYQGLANRQFIRSCKEVAKEILVIGNGDIFDPKSAEDMFQVTGCDAILVARGTMGQPWIAEEILSFFRKESYEKRSSLEIKEVLFDHFEEILRYQPERKALLDIRRVGCWYLKRLTGVKELRMQLNRAPSTKEAIALLKEFSWEEASSEEVCLQI